MSLQEYLCGLLLGLTIASLLAWRRLVPVLHMKRLAEAKLTLAECVTEFQKRLASGDIAADDFCHDGIYLMMFRSQFLTRYLSWRMLTYSCSRRCAESGARRAVAELEEKNPELVDILFRFAVAYYRAARYRHPYLSHLVNARVMLAHFGDLLRRESWAQIKRLHAIIEAQERTGAGDDCPGAAPAFT